MSKAYVYMRVKKFYDGFFLILGLFILKQRQIPVPSAKIMDLDWRKYEMINILMAEFCLWQALTVLMKYLSECEIY